MNLNLFYLAYNLNLYAKLDIDRLYQWAHILTQMDLARDPKQIGNSIRRARKNRSLSQKQLGDKAGLRQATISKIENGHPATRVDSLLALLAALDLELRVADRSKGWGQEFERIF